MWENKPTEQVHFPKDSSLCDPTYLPDHLNLKFLQNVMQLRTEDKEL